jgi:hypothetical protein
MTSLNHFVYIKTDLARWTTGHYDENNCWHPERDCASPDYAAARAAWLNGSGDNPGNEIEWTKRRQESAPAQSPATPNATADTLIVPVSPAGMAWYAGQLQLADKRLDDALAVNQGLATENANLTQELSELHELLAVAGETVANLERALESERAIVKLAVSAAGMFGISLKTRRYVRIHNAMRAHRSARGAQACTQTSTQSNAASAA